MKRGKIRSLTKEYLTELIINSISLSEILRTLSLDTSSGNFRTLKRKLYDDQINYDHIKNGPGYDIKNANFFKKRIPLNDILKENSYFNPIHLKKKLINNGMLQKQCAICHIETIWNSLPLCLQLDHINGCSSDNRIDNLRLLCPNCHSQTSTYAGRNKTKIKKEKITKPKKYKIIWPTDNDLILMLRNTNYVQVSNLLGISGNAIRKRLRINGYNPKNFNRIVEN